MTPNERIRVLRKTLKMKQFEFSRAIFVSNSYVAEIENGKRTINDRILRLISLTFGASERWLKTGEGDMFQSSPVERKERILALFNELNPSFQEYALSVVDRLLKLQREQKPLENAG